MNAGKAGLGVGSHVWGKQIQKKKKKTSDSETFGTALGGGVVEKACRRCLGFLTRTSASLQLGPRVSCLPGVLTIKAEVFVCHFRGVGEG